MKIYISQRMFKQSKEDILSKRLEMEDLCKKQFGSDGIEFKVMSIPEDSADETNNSMLLWLGDEIKKLSECSVFVSSGDAFYCKSCNMIHFIASLFGMKCYLEYDLKKQPPKSLKG